MRAEGGEVKFSSCGVRVVVGSNLVFVYKRVL